MKTVRILFLAASTRNSLLERFYAAAEKLGVKLEIYSFEDSNPWHPIALSGLAKVVAAPSFDDASFEAFLSDFVKNIKIHIVIPGIDRATIALAKAAPKLEKMGITPLVSSLEVCEVMMDKVRSDKIFRQLGIPVPVGDSFPLLAKPKFGASSRGIVTLNSPEELSLWKKSNKEDDFLIQSFISGREYTVDAYVDRRGRTLGIVSRLRIVVAGGEVMVGKTEHNDDAINFTKKLLEWGNWRGPVTVQIMSNESGSWIIECNPRVGGGITLSIEAGLAVPEWIIREYLELPLPDASISWREGLCMSRTRRDYFTWLS